MRFPLSALSLTDEEKAKIKAGNFTAGIAMHMMNTDWPVLQVNGIKSILEPLGVKIVAVTDGELKAEKQTADIESIMQMKPNVILAIAVDNDPLAPVFQTSREGRLQAGHDRHQAGPAGNPARTTWDWARPTTMPTARWLLTNGASASAARARSRSCVGATMSSRQKSGGAAPSRPSRKSTLTSRSSGTTT